MSLQSLNRLRGLLEHAQQVRRSSRRNTWRQRTVNSTPEQLERRELLSVTTAYDFVDVQNIDLTEGPAKSQPAATSLKSGGIAVSGTDGGHTDLDIFSGNLSDGGGAKDLLGTNSAIAELSNFNLVVVNQDADSIRYAIRNSSGGLVVGSTDSGDLDSSEPDVAALTFGGFWIVSQDTNGGTNWNIEARRFNNEGTLLGAFVVDSTSALDAKPALAVLGNGHVVVAWTRAIGFNTEVWHAVYTSTGTTVLAPALVDTNGVTNRNVDVARISGGFAIVYEDSEWDTGTRDITMKRFTSAGVLLGTTNISDPLASPDDFGHEAKPTITRLENGLLVVGWEDNRMLSQTDTFVWLVDPATGTRLGAQGRNVSAGEQESDDVGEIAIAGSANGRINVFHRNITDSDVDGESFAGRRTSTSNSGGDTIPGDSFIDIMIGAGGNDTLLGGGNNDQLDGGSGTDRLNGEAGQDILTGGSHADQFVFTNGSHSPAGAGHDTINDFSKTQGDKINVTAMDAMASTIGVNPFTQFLGSSAFTADGQIRAFQSGPDTIVQFNTFHTAANSGPEMEIRFVNYMASTLALSDFILVEGFASFASAATGRGFSPNSTSPISRLTADLSRISMPLGLSSLEITAQTARRGDRANQSPSAATVASTVSQKRNSLTGQTGSTPPAGSTRQAFGGLSQLHTLDAAFADITPVLLPLG